MAGRPHWDGVAAGKDTPDKKPCTLMPFRISAEPPKFVDSMDNRLPGSAGNVPHYFGPRLEYQDQLADLRKENFQLKVKIYHLELKLKHYNLLENKEIDVEFEVELQNELIQKDQRLEEAQKTAEEFKEKYYELKQKVEEQDGMFTADSNFSKQKIQQLQDDIDAKERQIEDLQSFSKTLEMGKKKKNMIIWKLLDKLKELRSDNKKSAAICEETVKDASSDELLQIIDQECEDFECSVKSKDERLKEVTSTLETVSKSEQVLQQELQKLNSLNRHLDEGLHEMDRHCLELKDEVDISNKRRQSLEESFNSQTKDLKQRLASKEQLLQERTVEMNSLESKLRTMQSSIEKQRSSLPSASQRRASLEDKQTSTDDYLQTDADTAHEIGVLQKRILDLNSQLQRAVFERRKGQDVQDKEIMADSEESDHRDAKNEIKGLRDRMMDLESQMLEEINQKNILLQQKNILQDHVEKLARFMQKLIDNRSRQNSSEEDSESLELLSQASNYLDETMQLSHILRRDLSNWELCDLSQITESSFNMDNRFGLESTRIPEELADLTKMETSDAAQEGRPNISIFSSGHQGNTKQACAWRRFTSNNKSCIYLKEDSAQALSLLESDVTGNFSFSQGNYITGSSTKIAGKSRACWNLPVDTISYRTNAKTFRESCSDNRLSSDTDIWSEPDREVSLQRVGIEMTRPQPSPGKKNLPRGAIYNNSKLSSDAPSQDLNRSRRRRNWGYASATNASGASVQRLEATSINAENLMLKDEIQHLKENLLEQEQVLNDFRDAVQNEMRNVETLTEEIQRLNKCLFDEHSIIKSLQEQLQLSQETNVKLKDEFGSSEAMCSQLQLELKATRSKLLQMLDTCSKYELEAGDFKEEKDTLLKQNQILENKVQCQENRIDVLIAENTDIKQRLEQVENQHQKLTNENSMVLSKFKLESASNEQAARKSEITNEQLQFSVDHLKNVATERENIIGQLYNQIQDLQRQNSIVETQSKTELNEAEKEKLELLSHTEKLAQDLKSNELQLKTLLEKNAVLENDTRSLRDLLREKESIAGNLQNQLQTMMRKMSRRDSISLESKLELEERVSTSEIAANQVAEEVNLLIAEVAVLKDEKLLLAENIADLRNECDEKAAIIDQLNDTINSKKSAQEDLKSQLEGKNQKEIEGYENEILTLNNELGSLKTKLSLLQEECIEKNALVAQQKEEIKNADFIHVQSEHKQLCEMNDLKNKNLQLERELSYLGESKNNIRKAHEEKSHSVIELQNEIQNVKLLQITGEKQLEQQHFEEVTLMKNKNSLLEKENSSLKESVQRLELENSKNKSRLSKLMKEMEETISQHREEGMQETLKHLEEIHEFKRRVSIHEVEDASLRESIANLQKDNDSKHSIIESLRDKWENRILSHEENITERELKNLDELHALKQDMFNLEKEKLSLEEEVLKMQKEHDEKTCIVEQLKQGMEENKNDWEQARALMEMRNCKELEILKKDIATAQKERAILEESLSELEKDCINKTHLIEELTKEIEDSKVASEILESSLDRNEANSLKSELLKLQNEYTTLKDSMAMVQECSSEKENLIGQLKSEVEDLSARNRELKKKLDDSRSTDTESETFALKCQLSDLKHKQHKSIWKKDLFLVTKTVLIERLTAELHDAKESITCLQSKIVDYEDKVANQEKQLNNYREVLEESKKELCNKMSQYANETKDIHEKLIQLQLVHEEDLDVADKQNVTTPFTTASETKDIHEELIQRQLVHEEDPDMIDKQNVTTPYTTPSETKDIHEEPIQPRLVHEEDLNMINKQNVTIPYTTASEAKDIHEELIQLQFVHEEDPDMFDKQNVTSPYTTASETKDIHEEPILYQFVHEEDPDMIDKQNVTTAYTTASKTKDIHEELIQPRLVHEEDLNMINKQNVTTPYTTASETKDIHEELMQLQFVHEEDPDMIDKQNVTTPYTTASETKDIHEELIQPQLVHEEDLDMIDKQNIITPVSTTKPLEDIKHTVSNICEAVNSKLLEVETSPIANLQQPIKQQSEELCQVKQQASHIKELEAFNAEKTKEIFQLKCDLQSRCRQIDDLSNSLQQRSQRVAELGEEALTSCNTIEQLRADLDEKSREILIMGEQLQYILSSIYEISDKNEVFSSKAEAASIDSSQIEIETQHVMKNILIYLEAKDRTIVEHEKKESSLEDTIHSMDLTIRDLQHNLQECILNEERLLSENKKLNHEVSAKSSEIENNKKYIMNLNEEYEGKLQLQGEQYVEQLDKCYQLEASDQEKSDLILQLNSDLQQKTVIIAKLSAEVQPSVHMSSKLVQIEKGKEDTRVLASVPQYELIKTASEFFASTNAAAETEYLQEISGINIVLSEILCVLERHEAAAIISQLTEQKTLLEKKISSLNLLFVNLQNELNERRVNEERLLSEMESLKEELSLKRAEIQDVASRLAQRDSIEKTPEYKNLQRWCNEQNLRIQELENTDKEKSEIIISLRNERVSIRPEGGTPMLSAVIDDLNATDLLPQQKSVPISTATEIPATEFNKQIFVSEVQHITTETFSSDEEKTAWIAKLQDQHQAMNLKIKHMQQSVEEYSSREETQLNEIALLKQELLTKDSELKQTHSVLSNLQKNCEENNLLIGKLEENFKEETDRNEQLARVNQEKSEMVSQLENQVREKLSILKEQFSNLENCFQEISNLKGEMARLSSLNSQLQNELYTRTRGELQSVDDSTVSIPHLSVGEVTRDESMLVGHDLEPYHSADAAQAPYSTKTVDTADQVLKDIIQKLEDERNETMKYKAKEDMLTKETHSKEMLIQDLQQKINENDASKASLLEALEELKQDIELKDLEINKIDHELKSLQNDFKEKSLFIVDLQRENVDLLEKNQGLIQYSQNQSRMISKCENDILEKVALADQLSENLHKYMKYNSKLENAISDLKQNLDVKCQQNTEFETEIARLSNLNQVTSDKDSSVISDDRSFRDIAVQAEVLLPPKPVQSETNEQLWENQKQMNVISELKNQIVILEECVEIKSNQIKELEVKLLNQAADKERLEMLLLVKDCEMETIFSVHPEVQVKSVDDSSLSKLKECYNEQLKINQQLKVNVQEKCNIIFKLEGDLENKDKLINRQSEEVQDYISFASGLKQSNRREIKRSTLDTTAQSSETPSGLSVAKLRLAASEHDSGFVPQEVLQLNVSDAEVQTDQSEFNIADDRITLLKNGVAVDRLKTEELQEMPESRLHPRNEEIKHLQENIPTKEESYIDQIAQLKQEVEQRDIELKKLYNQLNIVQTSQNMESLGYSRDIDRSSIVETLSYVVSKVDEQDETDILKLQEAFQRLESELHSKNAEIDKLQLKVQSYYDNEENLLSDVARLKHELIAKDSELMKSCEIVSAVQQDWDTKSELFSDLELKYQMLSDRNQKLELDNQEKDAMLVHLKANSVSVLDKLKEKLEETTEEDNHPNADIEENMSSDDNTRLLKVISAYEAVCSELEKKMLLLREKDIQVGELISQNTKLESKIQNFKSQSDLSLPSKSDQSSYLSEEEPVEVLNLKAELNKQTQLVTQLKAQRSRIVVEYEQISTELKVKDYLLKERENAISQLETEIRGLRSGVASDINAESVVRTLVSKCILLTEERDALKSEMQSKEEHLDKLTLRSRSSLVTSFKSIAEKERLTSSDQQKRESESISINQLMDRINQQDLKHKAELFRNEHLLAIKDDKIKELQLEISSLKSSLPYETSSHKVTSDDRNSIHITKLEKQLEKRNSDYDEVTSKLHRQQSVLDTKDERIKSLTRDVSELKSSLRNRSHRRLNLSKSGLDVETGDFDQLPLLESLFHRKQSLGRNILNMQSKIFSDIPSLGHRNKSISDKIADSFAKSLPVLESSINHLPSLIGQTVKQSFLHSLQSDVELLTFIRHLLKYFILPLTRMKTVTDDKESSLFTHFHEILDTRYQKQLVTGSIPDADDVRITRLQSADIGSIENMQGWDEEVSEACKSNVSPYQRSKKKLDSSFGVSKELGQPGPYIMESIVQRSNYSSPDLGIESDPNQEHLLQEISDKNYLPASGKESEFHKIEGHQEQIHAVGVLKEFELLKKEIAECLVCIKVISTRASEGMHLLKTHASPKKMVEHTTLKGIFDSCKNVEMCLHQAERIVSSFWFAPYPLDFKSFNTLYEENKKLKQKLLELVEKQSVTEKKLEENKKTAEFQKSELLRQLHETKKVMKTVKYTVKGHACNK